MALKHEFKDTVMERVDPLWKVVQDRAIRGLERTHIGKIFLPPLKKLAGAGTPRHRMKIY